MAMSENPSKSPLTAYIVGFVAIVLCAGIFWGLSQQMNLTEATNNESTENSENFGLEGQMAPDFALKNLEGKTVKLSDYRGKVVFLNFWATWCEPCKEEMPSMQKLREKMKAQPFEILAISLDNNPVQAVPAFVKKTGLELNFPVLQDPEQKLAKTSYKTTGVPESFLIDGEGKVVKHVIGSFEWDSPQIVDYFEKLIQPATVPG